MVKPPAHKLPHLLATLPRAGKSALVRQVDWPANSFYKVVNTKLKFREDEKQNVKAGGKAWGVLFWKGKLVPPRKNAPAPQIRGGLKHLWREVPADSLSDAEQAAIAEGERTVAEMQKAADEEMARRHARNVQIKKELAAKRAEALDARIRAAHEND